MFKLKKFPTWVILVLVALVAIFLVYRTSGFVQGSPIVTDQGELPTSLTSQERQKTSLSCLNESGLMTMDGEGYGICGLEKDVNTSMNYTILSDASDRRPGD